MSTKSRAVSARGVQEFKLYITRAIPVGAVVNCADNSGNIEFEEHRHRSNSTKEFVH